jgi:intracellular septation protein A
MFALFNVNWIEFLVLGGLGVTVLLIVLAVIFLSAHRSPQDRARDED